MLKNSVNQRNLSKQKPENPYRVYNTPEILGGFSRYGGEYPLRTNVSTT